MSAPKRKKIVFVCTGNTCRSPMAEILLKDRLEKLGLKGFTVTSAGTKAKRGDRINPKSAQVLEENGLAVKEFASAKLTDKLAREAFAIVCMTAQQRDYLLDFRWNALRKVGEEGVENNVYTFEELTGYEILDPYGRDIECYRYVFGLLAGGMGALIEKLQLPANAYVPKTRAKTTKKRSTGTTRKNNESEEKTK